jgi:hypothetical protein
VVLLLSACVSEQPARPEIAYEEAHPTPIIEAPAPRPGSYAPADRQLVAHGEYLVELLACGACHTHGALIGEPDTERGLAGSRIGIAFINPLGDDRPGIVFAPNITPDIETGIGAWSDAQIGNAIRAGKGRYANSSIVVMPWPGYARLSQGDVTAMVAYLRSIEPVEHQVPNRVLPGQKTDELFVYFGVYHSK